MVVGTGHFDVGLSRHGMRRFERPRFGIPFSLVRQVTRRRHSTDFTLDKAKAEHLRTVRGDIALIVEIERFAVEGFGSAIPQEIAGERKMLSTSRERVSEKREIGCLADRLEIMDGIGDVGGVPVQDRSDDQIQPRRSILQSLVYPVDGPALSEHADRLRLDVTHLTLVQAGLAAPAKVGIFQLFEYEESPLDAVDFLQGEVIWFWHS